MTNFFEELKLFFEQNQNKYEMLFEYGGVKIPYSIAVEIYNGYMFYKNETEMLWEKTGEQQTIIGVLVKEIHSLKGE